MQSEFLLIKHDPLLHPSRSAKKDVVKSLWAKKRAIKRNINLRTFRPKKELQKEMLDVTSLFADSLAIKRDAKKHLASYVSFCDSFFRPEACNYISFYGSFFRPKVCIYVSFYGSFCGSFDISFYVLFSRWERSLWEI